MSPVFLFCSAHVSPCLPFSKFVSHAPPPCSHLLIPMSSICFRILSAASLPHCLLCFPPCPPPCSSISSHVPLVSPCYPISQSWCHPVITLLSCCYPMVAPVITLSPSFSHVTPLSPLASPVLTSSHPFPQSSTLLPPMLSLLYHGLPVSPL